MSPRKKRMHARKPRVTSGSYGWVPDLPDHRDILYRSVRPVPPSVPDAVDTLVDYQAVADSVEGRSFFPGD